MLTHLDNEADLISEARAGNAEAFVTLTHHYERRVYRLVRNLLNSREDAEDALQETFLKAYRHLREFRGDSRFYTWVTRIAVNEAMMSLRRRRAEQPVSLDEPVDLGDAHPVLREIEDWGENPEERYAQVELQRILDENVRKLEPPYRTVFLLRDMEELSTEETAQALGLTVPAVKSRLLRARLKLRDRLNKYFRRGDTLALSRCAEEAVGVSGC